MTKPEKITAQVLESIGFVVKSFSEKLLADPANCFYTQVPFNKMILDFALPTAYLAIEINGDYWHGSRTNSVTARQLKRKMDDEKKSKALFEEGWKLLTIVASDIERAGFANVIQKRIWDLLTLNI